MPGNLQIYHDVSTGRPDKIFWRYDGTIIAKEEVLVASINLR